MDANDLVVILSVRALAIVRSPGGVVAGSAKLLQALCLLLLKCRSLFQECGKLASGGNALLQAIKEGVDSDLY